MKWLRAPDRPIPKQGDERRCRVFAWTPRRVGPHVVWLQSYTVVERYFSPASGSPGWWSVISEFA